KTVEVEGGMRGGDVSPIFSWVSEKMWRKGSVLTTDFVWGSSWGGEQQRVERLMLNTSKPT
ncbi:hypothetical protein K6U44_14885, partial [Vibrio parahaemolyticus]|uniref:hypothetical protein n=1 Tax=Vibrio parahaemolyticus TaxID=670 RepID=UPI001EEBEDE2